MQNELRLIREQMKGDFEFTMKALARQRDVLDESMQATKAALDEQQRILGEHVERTDQRFGQLIDVVVGGHEDRLEAIEERVARLEARQPPAA